MRYLISYDAARPSGDRLQKELARRQADPLHRWTWMLESELRTPELLLQLLAFVEAAGTIVVVDVSSRDVAVAHGPDRTVLAEVGTRTERSLAAAFLAATTAAPPADPAPAIDTRPAAEPEPGPAAEPEPEPKPEEPTS